MVLAGQMRCSSVLKEEWTYLRVFSLIKWQSGDAPWLSALITSRILKRHVGLLKLISVSPLNSFYFLSAFGLSHKPEICAYCEAAFYKTTSLFLICTPWHVGIQNQALNTTHIAHQYSEVIFVGSRTKKNKTSSINSQKKKNIQSEWIVMKI